MASFSFKTWATNWRKWFTGNKVLLTQCNCTNCTSVTQNHNSLGSYTWCTLTYISYEVSINVHKSEAFWKLERFILCKTNTNNAKLLLYEVATLRTHRLDLTKIRTQSLMKQSKSLFIKTNYIHVFLMTYITRFFNICS